MGKNKATSIGKGADPAIPKPWPTPERESSDLKTSGDPNATLNTDRFATTGTSTDSNGDPLSNTSRSATTIGDTNSGDTRRKPSGLQRELPTPTHAVKWPDFQTGDMQVMVAETHVFRVHQEIMAAHSKFFKEQLKVSVDSEGLVVAPRSEDIPVVILRDVCVDAFIDILEMIYPRPGAESRRLSTSLQAERLLQTADALGMPGITDFAMHKLASDSRSTPISIYELAKKFSLPSWQIKSIRQLVYRTRSLSDEEAKILGTLTTARIARLREEFRARIFARFEPVIYSEGSSLESNPHRSGADSELVRWSTVGTTAGTRPELGKCQQAILESLKTIFNVDGSKSDLERYIIQEEASVMRNMVEWLRLGAMGGIALCQGCMVSVERAARMYCRKDEMDARIESEVGGVNVLFN